MSSAYIGSTDVILNVMFKYDANAHVVKWRACMQAYGSVEAYHKRMEALRTAKNRIVCER